MSDDERFMRRALELAARGRGFVEPNPMVGAVVARGDQIIGEGHHERFGAAHAEVNALAQAGAAACEATLYVTLEPCCHHGKTPPCTDAVIAAGIAHVVVALIDPFDKVAGQGIARLREAGITVDVGLLGSEARAINAPFLKLVTTGLPYVHAKWAMTLDGKIATATGDSKWISGEASRRVAHELRGRMDAIIVGIGTVLADDPLLTARPPGPRVAARVVLDSQARLPLTSQLARTARDLRVIVATSDRAPGETIENLRKAGCECLKLPQTETGVSMESLFAELGRRNMTNVLVEGGSQVLGSLVDARQIDEVHVFVAPKLIGGSAAGVAIGGSGVRLVCEAMRLESPVLTPMGDDCYVHGRCHSVRPEHVRPRTEC